MSANRTSGRTLVLSIMLLTLLVTLAHAQIWQSAPPPASDVTLFATAGASCLTACPAPGFPPPTSTTVMIFPGLGGDDVTYIAEASCIAGFASCGCRAHGWARLGLRGLGTCNLSTRAEAVSVVKHTCQQSPDAAYNTFAVGQITAMFDMTLSGVAPGSNVDLQAEGVGFSFNTYDPEAGTEDIVNVTPAGAPLDQYAVAGVNLLLGQLALPLTRGNRLWRWDQTISTGPASIPGGTIVVPIAIVGWTDALITNPSKGGAVGGGHWESFHDFEQALIMMNGSIRVGCPSYDPCPVEPVMRFSMDIGGDTEVSDPTPDANEVFDPGDLYDAGGALMLPPGMDGSWDDFSLYAADPSPDVPFGPPAPACSGAPWNTVPQAFIDLDGADSIDFNLVDLLAASPHQPNGALASPIAEFDAACVHPITNLVFSYDDDTSDYYASALCSIPSASASSLGMTHGATADRDEVLGLYLTWLPTGFTPIVYPLASESEVHANLLPNPPVAVPGIPTPQDFDDDVDALDLSAEESCTTWLVGIDHEARQSLSWGTIYQVDGAGVITPAIIPAIHLGLPPTTDVRDFELVWSADPSGGGGQVLTLVFTVAPNDPATPFDDSGSVPAGSGSMNPNMIYYSYLTGASYPLLAMPLDEPIDALAAWCEPLYPAVMTCGTCRGDNDGNNRVNGADTQAFVNCMIGGMLTGACACSDMNGDGMLDDIDVMMYVNRLLSPADTLCP